MTLISLLEDLEQDHLSGASTLMLKAVKIFKLFLISQATDHPNLYMDLLNIGKKLISIRPHMACVINLVDDLSHLYKKTCSLSECISFLDGLCHMHTHSYEESARELSCCKTLLTHSYSLSVFLLIKSLKNFVPHLKVFVTESRPLNEGVKLAEDLHQDRVDVTFITDAAALTLLNKVDVVLLGSDFITKNYFSNKVGSLALALGCHFFKKELFVVTDSTKYIPYKKPILQKNNFQTDEVLEEVNFNIENPYFEIIPTKYVKKILAPQGAFSLKQARNKIFKKRLHNKTLLKNLSS